MPMKRGSSRKVIAENIREFHHGERYQKIKARHGKAVADKAGVAAAMRSAGRSRRAR